MASLIFLSSQIYFIVLVYSYASHLRMGSYRSLPLTRPSHNNANNAYETTGLPDEEEEEIQDFYRVPLRAHNAGNNSIPGIADFINAPGRTRKPRSRTRSASRNRDGRIGDEENVVFDENESTAYASSSRAHSSRGETEDNTSVGTDDERGNKNRH